MLREKDITIRLKCQQYETVDYILNPEETEAELFFSSVQRTDRVNCPACGGKVNIHSIEHIHLKDMPIRQELPMGVSVMFHRYRCRNCRAVFAEDIPMKYPGARITKRAARWIKALLLQKLSIRAVQIITGIHWETVRNIHKEIMQEALEHRKADLKEKNYKPKYLAVDEFAVHKGHTYATCVMDLEQGDVIWVGEGRSKEKFRKFFEDIPEDYLSDVIAIAMDMNASYHILVREYMPHARIVYDRYHMQAQFGKEVLGVVRLEEARKHNAKSKEIRLSAMQEKDIGRNKELYAAAKAEMRSYSSLKKLRWSLLRKSSSLSDASTKHLKAILANHSSLATCYAMKEELTELYKLQTHEEAEKGWKQWFSAAKESGIPALKRFAELKECRIDGLIAHAEHPISTGKLEGFNNKIKVAKRVGYGYRDDDYFFMLVKSLSLPSDAFLHNFP